MTEPLMITPRTKVLQLFEAYPQLEGILIAYIPAFKKLENPVLRKTIAKITTLQQAAAIGGVAVEELINKLRAEVGQDLLSDLDHAGYSTSQPAWFSKELVLQELDIRSMLAAGEQPVNQVMADLQALKEGAIYKLTAPFLPAPVIDKASSLGFDHWLDNRSEEVFIVYFHKPGVYDDSDQPFFVG